MNNEKENFLVKLFVQASHYVSGTVLIMLGGFISLPILTRVFSRGEYGILSLVSITLWIALAFSKAGMGESAVRFYSEFKTGERKQDISVYYTTLILSALVFAIAISLILYFLMKSLSIRIFGDETNNLNGVVITLVITGTLLIRLSNFFRAAQKTKTYNIVMVTRRFLSLALGITFLYVISLELRSFYLGLILAEVIIIAVLGCNLVIKNQIKLKSFSWPFFTESLLFGFPLIVNELAVFLLKSTDRYLIQFFLGAEPLGIYSLGSDLCLYISITLAHPLFYAVVPIYLELWNKKGAEPTKEFLSKVFNYYSLIAMPIMFGFIALAKQAIPILASEKFLQSTSIIPYILPGIILWGYYPIVTAGLYIHKQTKKLSLLTFLGVGLNIVLNLILIPRMQLIGAALATLFTFAVLTCVLVIISSKYLKIKVNLGVLFKIILASGIMFVAITCINLGSGVIPLLIHLVFGSIIYGLILLLIEKNIRASLINVSRRILSKWHFRNDKHIAEKGVTVQQLQ